MRRFVRVSAVLAALIAVGVGRTVTPRAAQTLTVAAASDLQAALPPIAARFEKDTGSKLNVAFGSSGNFFTQIQNGAPFDVFMSADIDYPRQLERAGLADKGTLQQYATGRLALWTRRDSGVDISPGLPALTGASVQKIAIANPAHAPYGRAAVAALRHEGVYDHVHDKLVLGENISQAAQFAQTGNAQVGILALSLTLAPAMKSAGTSMEIPAGWHPPIEQAAIVLAASSQKPLARQFLEALRTPESVRILESFGFALPAPAVR